MASCIYSKILPDYSDLDNNSGERPGYKVFILENDGGISVQFQNADDESDSDTLKAVFMNVCEAKEMLNSLEDAINRASIKKAKHKNRSRNI